MVRLGSVAGRAVAALVALLALPAFGAASAAADAGDPAAVAFDGQLQAGGIVDLSGRLDGVASLRHLVLSEGVGEVLRLEGDLAFTLVEDHTAADVAPATFRTPAEPVAARSVQVLARPSTTLMVASDNLTGDLDGGSLRLLPYAEGLLATAFVPVPDPWQVVPSGGCAVADGAPATLSGPVRLLAHAATVVVDGQPYETGPSGNAALRTATFAVVTASHATLAAAPGAAWRSCAQALDLTVRGTMLVQDVRYAADLGPGYVSGDEARFAAEGDLRAVGRHDGASSRWRIQGTVTAVTAGDGSLWTAAATVAVATVGAGALGFAIWLLAALRAQAFDNGNRVRILEHIRRAPGASIHALQEGTGLGTTTVRFHLRILAREGLVQSYRQGVREHYVAAGAGAGATSLARARAALLQHPVRAQIHLALADAHGPLDYGALVRHWQARSQPVLSRPLAEYHLKLMAKQGLVVRVAPGARWKLAHEAGADSPLAAVPAAQAAQGVSA